MMADGNPFRLVFHKRKGRRVEAGARETPHGSSQGQTTALQMLAHVTLHAHTRA
jgi:hypothetical protein